MKYVFTFLFISLFLTVSSQRKINKANDVSFDSLLILKGNQSKGKVFTEFSLSNGTSSISNRSFMGKITFLNFWFKACPPCIAEMRALNELYAKLHIDKNFQFLSLTFENEKTISEMKKKYHIQYPVFNTSKDNCYKLNQGNGFPTSIIIDDKGVIVFLLSGYNTDPVKAYQVLFSKFYPPLKNLLNNIGHKKSKESKYIDHL